MHRPYGPYERFIKRPQDFLLALLALILLSLLAWRILYKRKKAEPQEATYEIV